MGEAREEGRKKELAARAWREGGRERVSKAGEAIESLCRIGNV